MPCGGETRRIKKSHGLRGIHRKGGPLQPYGGERGWNMSNGGRQGNNSTEW